MNLATFDLNLLKVLDAIFREGSTVKAGARLGLSQSAVSSALGRLRYALGDALFVRQGNTLVATEFAESLRDKLGTELERIEMLLSPPKAFEPESAEGTFKISGSDFYAELLMPKLGDVLSKTAPHIKAQLIDLVPGNYVETIARGDADLAIIPDIFSAPLPDWARSEALFHAPFVVVAREGNPDVAHLTENAQMPFESFCSLPHVLFSPQGRLEAMGDAALAKVGRKRRVVMSVPLFSGVCRVVSESDLIALLPLQLAQKAETTYGLKWFLPPMPMDVPHLMAVWHARSDKAPLARWMRGKIFELMRPLDVASPFKT